MRASPGHVWASEARVRHTVARPMLAGASIGDPNRNRSGYRASQCVFLRLFEIQQNSQYPDFYREVALLRCLRRGALYPTELRVLVALHLPNLPPARKGSIFAIAASLWFWAPLVVPRSHRRCGLRRRFGTSREIDVGGRNILAARSAGRSGSCPSRPRTHAVEPGAKRTLVEAVSRELPAALFLFR
jgi:hypothetical protein